MASDIRNKLIFCFEVSLTPQISSKIIVGPNKKVELEKEVEREEEEEEKKVL